MREDSSFVDLKFSSLGDCVHYSNFHGGAIGVAYECENGCRTPDDTPMRWVEACNELGEDDSVKTFINKFCICPRCKSYKVKMLMMYPGIPAHRRYWFWDFSTYKKPKR